MLVYCDWWGFNCKECYDSCHSVDSLSEIAVECKAYEETMYERKQRRKTLFKIMRDTQQKRAK